MKISERVRENQDLQAIHHRNKIYKREVEVPVKINLKKEVKTNNYKTLTQISSIHLTMKTKKMKMV